MLPASSHKRKRKSDSRHTGCGKVFVVFALAFAMLPWMVVESGEMSTVLLSGDLQSDSNSNAVVLALTNVESPDAADTPSPLPGDSSVKPSSEIACALESTANLSLVELPMTNTELLPFAI